MEPLSEISELSDDDHRRLIEMRGGCSCHLNPPCNACSDPLTLAEAADLGLEEPKPSTRIALPNDKWVRSPKMPEYAVCMDPQDRFFGWKMIENPDGVHWTSVGKLSLDEAVKAEGFDEFANLKYEAGLLIDLLRDELGPGE